MYEKSTMDARPDDADSQPHTCIAGTHCRATTIEDGRKIPAHTTRPDTICDECAWAVEWTINDLTEIWLALHMSIGDRTRRAGQKVSGSRNAPINLNTDIDELKGAITEWLSAAASRVADHLNIDDPQPRNHTDTEHARVIIACTKILAPHVDTLIDLPADDVTIWLPASQTEHPGESILFTPVGGQSRYVPNTGTITMSGAQLALKLNELRHKARSLLAITTPHDKLSLPCPGCNKTELTRRHERRANREIDQIDCGSCGLEWPYERYRQLCLIWVKEDEMERDKLHKQLEAMTERSKIAEWLLAEREWQFTLALECTDVTASDFASTVLAGAKK